MIYQLNNIKYNIKEVYHYNFLIKSINIKHTFIGF